MWESTHRMNSTNITASLPGVAAPPDAACFVPFVFSVFVPSAYIARYVETSGGDGEYPDAPFWLGCAYVFLAAAYGTCVWGESSLGSSVHAGLMATAYVFCVKHAAHMAGFSGRRPETLAVAALVLMGASSVSFRLPGARIPQNCWAVFVATGVMLLFALQGACMRSTAAECFDVVERSARRRFSAVVLGCAVASLMQPYGCGCGGPEGTCREGLQLVGDAVIFLAATEIIIR